MRLDVLGLQAFLAVADFGSFGKAAEHLGITQTALSHRLRKFEDAIGATLVARTTRRVSLTPAGTALLPRARHLFSDARQIFADLAAEAKTRARTLAIGCLPTLTVNLLPRVVPQFLQANPGTSLRIFDNSAGEIAERVEKGDAAFGITVLGTDRWNLDTHILASERFVLLVRAGHPLGQQPAVRWSELTGEPLIRISPQTGNRMIIDDALGPRADSLHWVSEVQHVASAVSLVAAGAGHAVVPNAATSWPRGVVAVALTHPAISRTLVSVTRKGVPLTPLAADLLARIGQALKSASRTRDATHERT